MSPILEINDLSVAYRTPGGDGHAVGTVLAQQGMALMGSRVLRVEIYSRGLLLVCLVALLGALLGVDPDHTSQFIAWTNVISGQTDPDYVADPSVMARTRDEIYSYFHELTAERRARPTGLACKSRASVSLTNSRAGPPISPCQQRRRVLVAGRESPCQRRG